VFGANFLITVLFICFISLQISCDNTEEINLCENSVAEFRSRVSDESFHEIYEGANQKFKEAVNEQDFVNGLVRVASEIGKTRDFYELQSSKLSVDINNGRVFSLVYTPKQSGRVKLEEFHFVKENGKCVLYNYRYDYTKLLQETNATKP